MEDFREVGCRTDREPSENEAGFADQLRTTAELEEAQALLERHGWKVERPPFGDPYEVMYRKMMSDPSEAARIHPADNPLSPEYDWGEWDTRQLAFLKEHFILKTEAGQ